MSKIICDICGTSYPETAIQCPICGCVRPGDIAIFNDELDTNEEKPVQTYTSVKGGRFSKSNVKKRNEGKLVTPVSKPVNQELAKNGDFAQKSKQTDNNAPSKYAAAAPKAKKEKPVKVRRDSKIDVGYIIASIIFALAVVLIVIFLLIKFFPGGQSSNHTPDYDETTTLQTEESWNKSTKPSDPSAPVDPDPTNPINPTDPTNPTSPTEPDPTTPVVPDDGYVQYTVKSGDTLWEIAVNTLGDGSRYTEIVELNSLQGEGIYVGQVLNIPYR